jgi:bacterioferritin (cytochrome b1)
MNGNAPVHEDFEDEAVELHYNVEELKSVLRDHLVLERRILEGDHDILIALSVKHDTLSRTILETMTDKESRLRMVESKLDRLINYGSVLYLVAGFVIALFVKYILPAGSK